MKPWRSTFLLRIVVFSLSLSLALVASAVSNSGGGKVFGLGGIGRTGTESLRIALVRLGFGPSYHMKDLLFEDAGISTSGHIEFWHQFALQFHMKSNDMSGNEQALKDLVSILDPWGSGGDWPLAAFPKELLKAYPDAKFILTVRSSRDWYRSISNTICNIVADNWYMTIVRTIPFFPFNRFKIQLPMVQAVTRYAFDGKDFNFICDPNNSEVVMQMYEDWNAKVKKLIPKKKLLIFNTGKDSYQELASFLKVPVPEEPYPSSNSTGEIKLIFLGMQTVAFIVIMFSVFLVSALLVGVRRLKVQDTNDIKND